MTDGGQEVTECLKNLDSALAIFPRNSAVTELPEFSYLKGKVDMWGQAYDDNQQIDGLGPTRRNPVTAVYEPSLTDPQYPGVQYRVAVHEFGHHVMNLCFTGEDHAVWAELHEKGVERNRSVSGTESPPFSQGLMVNIDEFFAGLSQAYFHMHSLPTRHLAEFFPDQFEFLKQFYGPLTPLQTEDSRFIRYVSGSGFSTPWTVPVGGTYEHPTLGYSIELLPEWTIERELSYETRINIGYAMEVSIGYQALAEGADPDVEINRLAQSRVREWDQWTGGWDQSEVKSFEQVPTDGPATYRIRYYGHESPHYCEINVIEYLLTTSQDGRNFGVVLRGSSCGVSDIFAVPDLETMLGSFTP